MKQRLLAFAALPLMLASLGQATAADAPAKPTITIALDQTKAKIDPKFYGLMTEEINFAYEGGLYGELLRNRSIKGEEGVAYRADDPIYWSPVGDGSIRIDWAYPLNDIQHISLAVDASKAASGHAVGVANTGYWGVPARPNTTYTASFFAHAEGDAGPIKLAIVSEGGETLASATVSGVGPKWKRFEVTLRTGAIALSKANHFTLTTETPAKLWLQQVSLFGPTYHNRANGLRPDLMEKLAAMKPAFIRLPGGNYLEGDTFGQRFDWKATLGPLEQRPGHRSPWNYWSTDGMGLLEMLDWCEDLKAEPVLAVFAGYALNGQHVDTAKDLEPFIQDALDEIEYVSGDASTKWGARRAADGHPAPFPLHYVEIGNEDFFDNSGSYDVRFKAFYSAIKAKYPNLQLISTAALSATPSQRPDMLDEHFYAFKGETETYARVHEYDNRSRTEPKVFVGEWASHDGWRMPTLRAALADAAYLTGLERNADLVIMNAYAPLLANLSHVGGAAKDNSVQWAPNLIGYDALRNYGTPSYHVLQMFGAGRGDMVLASEGANVPDFTAEGKTFPALYWVATKRTSDGHVQLKVVNRSGSAQPIHVVLHGVHNVADTGTLTVLAGKDPGDSNSLDQPELIAPKRQNVHGLSRDFVQTVPAYSVSLLDFAAR
jgi:alpha-L-arabinofuranosidase